jgi:CheY-like chemotaxis protein
MNYLMGKTSLSDKQTDYHKKIDVSAKNLLRIIDDILDFSKIEAGKLTLENTTMVISDVVSEVADAVNVKLQSKSEVEFVTYVDVNIPRYVLGDSLRLRQVLLNLTDNAAKFTERGEIRVMAKLLKSLPYGCIVNFTIKDSGIGITDSQLKNLFNPFQQADLSTTRKYGGTGLGLTICRRIVEMMDGELSATSESGSGSEFTFNAFFSHAEAPEETASLPDYGLTALLADDSESARMVLTEMLSSLGFKVLVAENAPDAKRIWDEAITRDEEISLLVVDWKMPGMTGLELVKEIKDGGTGRIPSVVMVTSHGAEAVKDALNKNLVDGLLIKPIGISTLNDTIAEVLRQENKRIKKSIQEVDFMSLYRQHLQGVHLLLVEDNEINMELAMELLKDVGIICDSAWNGAEAIEKLKESNFDLVLMDIQMPIMDGLTAAKKIRDELNNKKLPVLAMTAHAMKGEREKSLAAGMNDHITKPIDPEFLYLTLRKFLAPESINNQLQTNIPDKVIVDHGVNSIKIEGISTATGIKRAAGKEDVYIKLLKTFIENYGSFKAKANQLQAQNRLDETGMLLHTLAGVSGNIGITEVYKLAQQLTMDFKEHIKGGSLNFTPILQNKLEEVANVLEIYLDRIHVFLASLETVHTNSKQDVSDAELDELLHKLGIAIAENDPVSIEQCSHLLEKIKLNDSLVELLKDVLNSINNFDFEEAMDKFNSIKTQ